MQRESGSLTVTLSCRNQPSNNGGDAPVFRLAEPFGSLRYLARSERFELPTLGFEVRCSIQLSYERLRARLPELAAQGYPQQNAVAVVRKSPTLVRGGLRSRDADGGPGQCSWPHPAHMHCSPDRRSRRR